MSRHTSSSAAAATVEAKPPSKKRAKAGKSTEGKSSSQASFKISEWPGFAVLKREYLRLQVQAAAVTLRVIDSNLIPVATFVKTRLSTLRTQVSRRVSMSQSALNRL